MSVIVFTRKLRLLTEASERILPLSLNVWRLVLPACRDTAMVAEEKREFCLEDNR